MSDGAFLCGAAIGRGLAAFAAVLTFALPASVGRLAMARAAGRLAIARAGAFLLAAVLPAAFVEAVLPAAFVEAVLPAAFFEAVLPAAFFEAAARGAARFFADLRPAVAAAGFRAADFLLAPPFRAAAEVLLAFFAAFFRPPVAEPFRFAITRSFRTPGTSSYLDSYR